MSNQKQRQEDIVKQLGPLKEVDNKIKLPEALIDYINEIEVGKYRRVKDLGQYCSEEVTRVMTSHLDIEDAILKNYTIPNGLQTHYYDEIMKKYYGWDMTK
ncbi:MAG TPA: hypothetical protein VKA95_00020 [Nitrososphaeraceae archaeon]|nr:hypothetical protein [Nitrososphaeraceae archaeon]